MLITMVWTTCVWQLGRDKKALGATDVLWSMVKIVDLVIIEGLRTDYLPAASRGSFTIFAD